MFMKKFQRCVNEGRFMRYLGEKGQGMVEYALILAFVVAVAAALIGTDKISGAIETTFGNITTKLNQSNNPSGGNGGGGNGGGGN